MKLVSIFAVATVVVALFGCGKSEKESSKNAEPTGKQYLATTEPATSTPVGDARTSAKDGEPITLVGRIGGSVEPFVTGLAAFTIVDAKVPFCAPDCGCKSPWDYCCELEAVKTNIATIKVVNESGKPVTEDARQLLGVKELNLVVVSGTTKRDEQGNLLVLAEKVFVKE